MRSTATRLTLLAGLTLAITLSAPATAQGGPPMVTDDPDTPGNGNWEINLGSMGERSQQAWHLGILDADINYGWGERIQLKMDTPLNAAPNGSHWQAGLGTTQLGVKWRFYDPGEDGWRLSTYPQLGINFAAGSVARGLAQPGKSFFLPLELAGRMGPLDVDWEIGRNFVQIDSTHPAGSNQWIAGLILAHHLDDDTEVMLEGRRTQAANIDGAGSTTLLNLGMRHQISDDWTLLGAIGHDVSGPQQDRTAALFYLGVQWHPRQTTADGR
jgi:hypothetical protein